MYPLGSPSAAPRQATTYPLGSPSAAPRQATALLSFVYCFGCYPPPIGWTISILSPSLIRVSAYCDRCATSRFKATAVNSRRILRWASSPSIVMSGGSSIGLPFTVTVMKKTARLSRKGAVQCRCLRVTFPSLELPSAGSRGPGPHPVLRKPPPATRSELYLSVELPCEGRRLGHRKLTDVVPAHVGGGPAALGSPVREERQPGGTRRALRSADHHPVRLVATEDRVDQRRQRALVPGGPHQRDLGHRPQVEVERGEVAAEARGVALHEIGHRTQGAQREGLVALLAQHDRQAQQPVD